MDPTEPVGDSSAAVTEPPVDEVRRVRGGTATSRLFPDRRVLFSQCLHAWDLEMKWGEVTDCGCVPD